MLNGQYTDGVISIGTDQWFSSDNSVATTNNDTLTGLKNGWVEASTAHQGNTYSKGLFVYTTFEALEIEPNNAITQPFSITADTFYEANIPYDTDTDYFRFTLSSDAVTDIGFLSKSFTADITIEILDDAETLLASATSTNGDPLILPLGLQAGTYFIKASSAGDIDETNPYIVTYKVQEPFAPKSTISLGMGDETQSRLYHLQDESLFTFSLPAPQTARIQFTPSGGTAKYRLELLNSAGTVIDTVDCLEHASVNLEGNYPADDYTIRVSPVDAIDAKAPFNISINLSDKQLETEPNDTIDQATIFDATSPMTARLATTDDADFFTFHLDAPRYLELSFDCPYSQKDFAIDIFKDSGENQIDGIQTEYGTGVALHMGLNVGDYYVKVSPLDDAETVHFYTLTLRDSAQTDLEIESNNTLKFANAIENGVLVRGRIYSQADADYFGFHVPDTTPFTVDFAPTTTTGDYTIQIVNDNDDLITQQTSTDGEAKSFPASAYGGNYYVKIGPGADIDQYNPYKLTLTSDAAITGLKQMDSLTVTGPEPNMTLDQTQNLSASAAYSDATATPIQSPTWTSLDETIATVDVAGLVTAAGVGATSIIATYGELTGKFDLTVGAPPNYYEQRHGNLILVAGGGDSDADTLRETIQYLSDAVYQRFQSRLFRDKDIFYFNPMTFHDLDGDGLDNGIVDDATPTVDEFGAAISEWAANQSTDGPLYVYLIDHGGADTFKIFPNEILTAADLSTYLDAFQTATDRPVVTVIEACKSGTFLDDLSAPNRVVVTSTGGGNDAYYELGGAISFSQIFMDRLLTGDSVRESWQTAAQKLSDMGRPYANMNPNLDPPDLAASIYVGGQFAIGSILPEVVNQTTSREISEIPADPVLQADASYQDGLEMVWAVVIPPDYQPPDVSDEFQTPDAALPKVRMMESEQTEGRYEAQYTDFNVNGDYRFIFHARGKDGKVSLSSLSILTYTGGTDLAQKGDINNDNAVNLTDLLIALKTLVGLPTEGEIRTNWASSGADVGGDGLIGLEEAIYALREAAGL